MPFNCHCANCQSEVESSGETRGTPCTCRRCNGMTAVPESPELLELAIIRSKVENKRALALKEQSSEAVGQKQRLVAWPNRHSKWQLAALALAMFGLLVGTVIALVESETQRDPLTYMPLNTSTVVQLRPAAIIQSRVFRQLAAEPTIRSLLDASANEFGLPAQRRLEEILYVVESVTFGFPSSDDPVGADGIAVIRFNRDFTLSELFSREEVNSWSRHDIEGTIAFKASARDHDSMTLVDPRTMIIGRDELISSALKHGSKNSRSPIVDRMILEGHVNSHLVVGSEVGDGFWQRMDEDGSSAARTVFNEARQILLRVEAEDEVELSIVASYRNNAAAAKAAKGAHQSLAALRNYGMSTSEVEMLGVSRALAAMQLVVRNSDVNVKATISEAWLLATVVRYLGITAEISALQTD